MIGTDFDVRVWETLLKIPMGRAVSYTDIARHIGAPSASRAVGSAVGRNPISFVVPCHRVLRGDGSLGGYHWGLTRKRALIGWETGRVAAASTDGTTARTARGRSTAGPPIPITAHQRLVREVRGVVHVISAVAGRAPSAAGIARCARANASAAALHPRLATFPSCSRLHDGRSLSYHRWQG